MIIDKDSDITLVELHRSYLCHLDEAKLLSKKILECQEKLDVHIGKESCLLKMQLRSQHQIMDKQRELVDAVHRLSSETIGLREAWKATQGTIKVGRVIGGFLKWVGGFGIVVAVVAWLSNATKHIN